MAKKEDKKFKDVYPNIRYVLNASRNSYLNFKNVTSKFNKESSTSDVIPDNYEVCNTNTVDSEFDLNVLEGNVPEDIRGNMYICQCLGTKDAFMVGDTNIVKINFDKDNVSLKNRMMWSPVSIAKTALQESKHRFDHVGLMYMSPGLGIFSYTEGMYLLPDGRLGITSDVDRPWIIDRENLKVSTPLGKRKEWLPMMSGDELDLMGSLFAGYSNSHVIYTDTKTNELFLVNYRPMQKDGTHPCYLMKADKDFNLTKWSVVDEDGNDILIKQSIHELIFTKDYIILADTAFATGDEILKPWLNAPLPNQKTVVYIVDRRNLTEEAKKVVAKRIEIDEACIHLIAEYENKNNQITMYMLHTPATNTAEIIRSYDRDLNKVKFPKHLVGYGTLPVLDLSSIGKHIVDMNKVEVVRSEYIRDEKTTWGPYMYTYMGRQERNFNEQDLYVMFKGYRKEVMPERIYNAYKDVENRKVSLKKLAKVKVNNTIARVSKDAFNIEDKYEFEDKVLLYTISCIESSNKKNEGYLMAAVGRDVEENEFSSGHEYWIFEANNLAKGPICKLGNKQLNNTILFHTVFISDKKEKQLDKLEVTYNVDLRKDYPKEELKKYNKEVLEVFNDVIWPYFNNEKNEEIENTLKEYTKKRVNVPFGKEHLIGESVLEEPVEFANQMYLEANRMFSTSGWKLESFKNGLKIESKPVKGVFESANVKIVRAEKVVNINADKLFKYMTSPEGYAIIDPVSNPDDHKKEPLQVYEWKEGARLEAAIATTEIPMMNASDFVVLNAIDPSVRMFASKSIMHDKLKGSSKYANGGESVNGNERAINTFVIKIEEVTKNKCKVCCINYADMCGKTSYKMNNFINTKVFFKPLYERIEKAIPNIK